MNDYFYVARVRMRRKDAVEDAFFGRGVADLLYGVEKYHSLNMAAQQMGMAYSKAWRIVRQAELAMGMTFLHRMRKKGSELTPEGRALLNAYEEAERAAWKAADEVIERYYGNDDPGSADAKE